MHRLTFGIFEIRPAQRVLLVNGVPVPLTNRPFDMLMALVERRQRVVSRAELLEIVWRGVPVGENNVDQQIERLRKILGNKAIVAKGKGFHFTLVEDRERDLPDPSPTASSARVQRRVVTLVAASVEGWHQYFAVDARAARSDWSTLRRSALEPSVPRFGGRVCELTADRVLVEFDSAVDAIAWALELQHRLSESQPVNASAALRMRLAVYVEDFVVDDARLIGEGVRSAALLAHAAAGQVVATDVVRVLAHGKESLSFDRLNGERVLGMPPLWVVRRESGGEAQAVASCRPKALHQATLAVLPFGGEVGEAERYFGDGMTEEIIASVSMSRTFLVISRNSTLRYRDSTLRDSEVAAELGVRYLLTGSAKRDGRDLCIRASLSDAPSDRVIWAETYNGTAKDLFAFQANIARSIAAAIDPHVLEAELARVRHLPTDNLDAYDSLLRGLAALNTLRSADFAEAGDLLRRAIQLDSGYAQAHAHLAWWHNLRFGEGRIPQTSEDAKMAVEHSLRAVELDPRDALSLSVAGHIQSFVKRNFEAAMDLFDRALALNHSCALAWARSATTLAYMGRGEEAMQRLQMAYQLSPFDPQSFAFYTTSGTAELVLGRDAEAAALLAKARRLNPGYRAATRLAIAALALAGERDEAIALAREFLTNDDPAFRVSIFGSWYPLCEPHRTRVLNGMRLGGLPD